MKTATVKLEGMAPLSQSKYYKVPKDGQEKHDAYEQRTWRERMHADGKGIIYVPPMGLKNAIVSAAKFLNMRIPGQGMKTYKKRFEAGVICAEPMSLGIKRDSVPGEWLFVPADGVSGSGKRVEKCFGRIDEWKGTATFQVIDEAITEDVFLEHIEAAGRFVGLGRFRPERNGFYGRFKVDDMTWK